MDKNLISIDFNAKDKEQAIREAGRLLKDNGYCNENYVDSMVETEKKLGPYIVITKNIALPHARPEDGAKKSGFSIVRLKEPIEFGNKENDPVKVVIGLCAFTNEEHVNTMSQIAEMMLNPEKTEIIFNGGIEEFSKI